MKNYINCFFFVVFFSNTILSQTITTSDGNWDNAINWNNGIPDDDEAASITHNMTLDTDLSIDDGSYIINNGTIIDVPGGADYHIEIRGSGYFEVGGNVTIGGNLSVRNDGELVIKACDTLTVEGDVEFRNDSKLTIESCAVLIVGGDLEFRNKNSSVIDGNILVIGSLISRNDAILTGIGNIQVEDEIEIRNSSTIFGSNASCSPGPCEYGSGVGLPIELISFEASLMSNKTVSLKWVTASETNNNYYTIEKAKDNNDFIAIATIEGAGNSQVKKHYSYNDDDLVSENTYYRLKQTDYDGKYSYSKIEVIRPEQIEINNLISLYPNPTRERLNIKGAFNSATTVSIIDLGGNRIKEVFIQNETNLISLEVKDLTPGIYFLIVNNPLQKYTERFIVSR